MRLRRQSNRGFTLVELMVVIVILGIIGTMAFVFVLDKPDKAKWEKARGSMAQIVQALNTYNVENGGEYPDSLEAIGPQFGGKIPVDPFSNEPFQYELGGEAGFTLTCLGKDRQGGGAEIPDRDIVYNKFGLVEDSQ